MDSFDYDKHFEKALENSVVKRAEQEMLHPSSKSEMLGAYCKLQEKYALRICYTKELPRDPDELEQKVRRNLFNMRKELESQITTHLIVDREAILLFDDEDRMNKFYDQVGEHAREAGPFYVQTIHKDGPVLRENT